VKFLDRLSSSRIEPLDEEAAAEPGEIFLADAAKFCYGLATFQAGL
jgi:hypothetical protein